MSGPLRVLIAALLLSGALAAPASSGDGLRMRMASDACDPLCPGDRVPAWSPDGRTIAFARPRHNQIWDIQTLSAAGDGTPLPVIELGALAHPSDLRWSPDQTHFAVTYGPGHLYVFPAAGGQGVRIKPTPPPAPGSFIDANPVWSLDGRQLAFTRSYDRWKTETDPSWCCEVWVARRDGSGLTLLSGGAAPKEWSIDPAWLPGHRIAYVTAPRTEMREPDLARAEIWTADADGSDRLPLVQARSQGGYHDLSWSQAEKRLYFVAKAGARRTEVRRIALDGSDEEAVSFLKNDDLDCCAFAPVGGAFAYMRLGRNGAMEIHVHGGPLKTPLVFDGVSAQSRPGFTKVSWAPDGRRLAYLSDGECPTIPAVYAVDLITRRPTRLTRSCRIDGDRRPNSIRGTERVDAIYGRGGNDLIRGFGRTDFIQGGAGRDHLFGGRAGDTIHGGPGADMIHGDGGFDALYSRDGSRDEVWCGPDRDSVRADRLDWVAKDCEVVGRR
jgi:Tol biopolymer transport system component